MNEPKIKSPVYQAASITQTRASAKTTSTKKQTDQRLINWAVYRLRGMQLHLPKIRSIPLEIAYQQFKDAEKNLIDVLKKEHLK